MGRPNALLGLGAALVSCNVYEPIQCRPCVDTCGVGLTCVDGSDENGTQKKVCVSEAQRCGIVDGCGTGLPCADGLECFQDGCRAPVQIEAGQGHACVRYPSGVVSCWGDSFMGQAGSSAPIAARPVQIPLESASSSGGRVRSIAVAGNHGCAVLLDGSAYCWGENRWGQLGNYVTRHIQQLYADSVEPVRVNLEGVRAISAGNSHTCAVTNDDALWCWGRNDQCLFGYVSRGEQDPQPIVLPGLASPPTALANGVQTVGVLAGGRVYAWGQNGVGELFGIGARAGACEATLSPLEGVRAISASGRHACALLHDGSVACFGSFSSGSREEPIEVRWDRPFVAVSSGGNNACARTDDGRLVCWGAAASGVLGEARMRSHDIDPIEIEPARGLFDFAVGASFACFVREEDGTWCWGSQAAGRLGDGGDDVVLPAITMEGDFVDVSVGLAHTCLVDRAGAVTCWGNSSDGQLGSGSFAPNQPPHRHVDPLRRFVDVEVGAHFSCAIDEEKVVWCWGRYDEPKHEAYGGAGIGPFASAPVRVASGALSLTTGYHHVCGVFESAPRHRCWGDDRWGTVDGNPVLAVLHTPVAAPLAGEFAHVVAGAAHTCAFRPSGEVDCWGPIYGEGGLDVVARPFGSISRTETIAGGERFHCALLDDGHVQCWGRNELGQLGTGRFGSSADASVVVELDGAVALSSFFTHTCAVLAGGRVRCWGQDVLDGRLGRGRGLADQSTPVEVLGVTNAVRVDAGMHSTCAIDRAGDVWCWGNDAYGAVSGRRPFVYPPKPVRALVPELDRRRSPRTAPTQRSGR